MARRTDVRATTNGRANGHEPEDAHEWVSFEDPHEQRRWVFDVTFLLSNWTCIYGAGCQGVLTGPSPELELLHFLHRNGFGCIAFAVVMPRVASVVSVAS